MKNGVINFLIWTLILLTIILVYSFQYELTLIYERVKYNIFPNSPLNHNTSKKIIIPQNLDGHFYVTAKLDTKKIKFLIDTGASDVFISLNDAKLLDIDINKLSFIKKYYTANGITRAAPYEVMLFEIGDIKIQNIKIYIGENYSGISLLGMQVIEKLNSFKIDNNLLIIEY